MDIVTICENKGNSNLLIVMMYCVFAWCCVLSIVEADSYLEHLEYKLRISSVAL